MVYAERCLYASFVWATCAVGLCAAKAHAGPPLAAFPGAEGFGAYAVGGRGGAVCIVDTLEDYLNALVPSLHK